MRTGLAVALAIVLSLINPARPNTSMHTQTTAPRCIPLWPEILERSPAHG